MSSYHTPPCAYIKFDDPETPAFTFDKVINPISAYRTSHSSKGGKASAYDKFFELRIINLIFF